MGFKFKEFKMKRILKQLGMNKTEKSKELLDYIFFNLNKIKNKTEDENIEFIFFTQWAKEYELVDTSYYISLTTKGESLLNELRKL